MISSFQTPAALMTSALLTSTLLSAQAHSFTVTNYLENYSASVEVLANSSFNKTLSPGARASCNYTSSSCNSSQTSDAQLEALINIDGLDFQCKIPFVAGGGVSVIYSQGMVQCRSFDVDGALTEIRPVADRQEQRSVRFLATADTQYENGNGGRNTLSDRTMAVMENMIAESDDIRGVVIAGDLTQNSRRDERKSFEASMQNFKQYVFEGMGNHDEHNPTWYQRAACPSLNSCVSPGDIMNMIDRNRNSILQKEQYKGGLYSWDWQDVHLVQLGSFIADTAHPDYSFVDPHKSLSFLKKDLAENVGKTNRPIILMSHYGFDGFSERWWSLSQRQAFWRALEGYNVVAIFSGHSHATPGSQWYRYANRPTGVNVGPYRILNVTAGAALKKAFVDVRITNNMLVVQRMTFDANDNLTPLSQTVKYIDPNFNAANHAMIYQNMETDKCWGNTTNHVALVNCPEAKKWTFETDTGRIRHVESNECITSKGENNLVHLDPCDDGGDQQWYRNNQSFVNTTSYQCLAPMNNNSRVGVMDCSRVSDQQWKPVLRLK